MKLGDIITATSGFSEQRIVKFFTQVGGVAPADIWLDSDISDIIERKNYWWREKRFTFSTALSTPYYDLVAGGTPIAADFKQIVNLYWLRSAGKHTQLEYVSNSDEKQRCLNSGTIGSPQKYFVNPNSNTQLVIWPQADAVYPMAGMYIAGYVRPSNGNAGTIPLIPTQFHYVPLLQFQKRIFLYLFGENDPRYTTVKAELEGSPFKADGTQDIIGAYHKLDMFQDFSQEAESQRPLAVPRQRAEGREV